MIDRVLWLFAVVSGVASRAVYNGSMAGMTYQPVVLCGPSGSGKSTLVKKLMAEFEGCFAFSISRE